MLRRALRLALHASFAVALGRGAGAQSIQYRSPAGVVYRAQPDTGPVARARAALAESPRDVGRVVALGTAQAGARQMREAIATFTRGLAAAPRDPSPAAARDRATLYRWRGHRHLSVREFAAAQADLDRALALDGTNYGALYHLGVLRYVRGDFAGAAAMFRRAQPRAPDAGELAGATDWLWMSLARAGRRAAADSMLAARPDSLATAVAYRQRLRLYRGEIGPDAVFTPADTSDVNVATLSYGVGNWFLLRGDPATARQWFRRAVASGGWPAFGFMASEAELRRLGARGRDAR